LRIDPWQAIGTAQRLRARGVSVDELAPQREATPALPTTGVLAVNLLDDVPGFVELLFSPRPDWFDRAS